MREDNDEEEGKKKAGIKDEAATHQGLKLPAASISSDRNSNGRNIGDLG
jgi:hypothetical protein